MRIRKKKKRNEERDLLNLGNFTITHKWINEDGYITISSATGSWQLNYKDDTFKYAWLIHLVANENMHDFLQSWVILMYHISNCSPDSGFMEDSLASLTSLNNRTLEEELHKNDKN